MLKISSFLFSLLLVMALSVANAWATNAPGEVDPQLQQRVSQYWDATQAGDWATTYRMELQVRDTNAPLDPMTYYKGRQGKDRYRNIKVERIDQAGDSAQVKLIAVEIKPIAGAAFTFPRFIESRWQRREDDWYHVEWKLYMPEELQKVIDERREAARVAAEDACRAHPEACPQETQITPPVQSGDQAAQDRSQGENHKDQEPPQTN